MDRKGTKLLLLFFAFLCAQVRKLDGDSIPGCIPIERKALLGFKEGLKYPTGRLSSWVGDHCCTWEGISCHNRTGHVVKLDLRNPHQFSNIDEFLSYNNKWSLGGELRPSLLGLKHLNYLDLSINYFGGIRIPEFMGSFRQLKYLNLSVAGFRGPIPHQLGNLSSLQYLDLGDFFHVTDHSGIVYSALSIDNALWISHLSSLRYLNMAGVKLRESAHWLQALNMLPSIVEVYLPWCGINTIPLSLPHVNFTSLSALDLSWNFNILTIPGWLCNISSLEHLDLSMNSINSTIPGWLFNISSLEYLDLSDNSINSTIPGWLFNISSLEYLDLSYNSINSTIPGWLFNMSSLEHLHLGGNYIWGIIPPSIKNLASLKFLDLSYNYLLEGKIPTTLGGLCKLQHLGLSGINISRYLHEFDEVFTGCIKNSLETLNMQGTQLSGYLPDWLWDFRMLKSLDFSYNSISGPLPQSIGRLSALEGLYLSSNQLNDIMSEERFANLTKLNYLGLSQNQLTLKLGSDWIPPFQLHELFIGSCKLGPRFPAWLRTQKNIFELDMSSTGISDTIPDWFWRSFSHIYILDISSNGITGSVPDLTHFINLRYFILSSNHFVGPLPNFNSSIMAIVDLSNNSFSGVIHPGIGKSMPSLETLSLSTNNLTGEIPSSLCQLDFFILDLSKNHMLGELPDCWKNYSFNVMVINFSSNNLSGSIPSSICSLPNLEALHLSNNNLSGELPISLKSCVHLNTLDLGQNEFTGAIPAWIGESLLSLKILSLRSNKLVGNIPLNLSRLSALQIMDLANNNLSGNIPSRFGNFTTMKRPRETYGRILDLINGTSFGVSYKDNIQVTIKGIYVNYDILLPLVIAMDLSNNNLSGMIPEELTSLFGLMSLNLSGNHLTGEIIENISMLRWLESLDLSRNNLSGEIPSSMIALTSLSYLNLSYNNLSGRIPTGNQFETFNDPSIYTGNPGLCGFSLPRKCKDDETNQGLHAIGGDEQNDNAMDKEGSEMKWLYMSMGLGFAVGFWVVFGPLLFNRKWREAYFRLIDQVYDMIYMALAVIFNRYKEHNFAA